MTAAELRRLLELAAKAAGYRVCHELTNGGVYVSDDLHNIRFDWNPADDDGDSRRLQVKLRIKCRYHSVLGQGLAWTEGDAAEFTANVEDCGRNECAATRLAVLRAAAAIGESMP